METISSILRKWYISQHWLSAATIPLPSCLSLLVTPNNAEAISASLAVSSGVWLGALSNCGGQCHQGTLFFEGLTWSTVVLRWVIRVTVTPRRMTGDKVSRHCMVERQSVLFTPPVSGSSVASDRCISKHTHTHTHTHKRTQILKPAPHRTQRHCDTAVSVFIACFYQPLGRYLCMKFWPLE